MLLGAPGGVGALSSHLAHMCLGPALVAAQIGSCSPAVNAASELILLMFGASQVKTSPVVMETAGDPGDVQARQVKLRSVLFKWDRDRKWLQT